MSIATPIATKTLKRDIKTSLIPSLLPLRLFSVGQRVYTEEAIVKDGATIIRQINYIVRGWMWVDPSAISRSSDVPFLEAGYHYAVVQPGGNDRLTLHESKLKPVK